MADLFFGLIGALYVLVRGVLALIGLIAVTYIYLLATELQPPPDTDPVAQVFKCEDPCIIKRNLGGNIVPFERAARAVRRGARQQVVIDGYCASACAIFADMARPHVCITKNAVFGFHKGRAQLEELRYTFDPPHTRDILSWVQKNGGFPAETMLDMRYTEAKRFWPTCIEGTSLKK